MFETSQSLFPDLTKPENTEEFPAAALSKKLIEWASLRVVPLCRNNQVAYRIVENCRKTYNRIIEDIGAIDQGIDDEIDFERFERRMGAIDAVNALEEYLFKFVFAFELGPSDYFARTETIHDCIVGTHHWEDNRKKLRDVALQFTTQDRLLAIYDPDMMREMERGVVEAAQEDNLAFYLDLRRVIDAHPLIDIETQARYDLNPPVQALIHDTIETTRTLDDAITQDHDVGRREERQTLSIQFLFILHGIMEFVIDSLGKADPDWQAHFRSREVWTAAKCVAESLNRNAAPCDAPYEGWRGWRDAFDSFVNVISTLPGVQTPQNWLQLVKISAKTRRPYLSRAWAVVMLSRNLVNFFNSNGNSVLRNVEPLERTIERAIFVLENASTPCDVTTKYDSYYYDTDPIVIGFTELESEIRERYRLFQFADSWADAEVLLRNAVEKDRKQIDMVNDYIDKVMAEDDPTHADKLVDLTIMSSVPGVPDTQMRVHRRTCLAAIRYNLSRQVTGEAERKNIVLYGRFDSGDALDVDIETICNGANSCMLRFVM